MKKFLLFFFLLSASVLPGSAAGLNDGDLPGGFLPRPKVSRPEASYYRVRLEPGFLINVFCYVSTNGAEIRVECDEALYAMDVTNQNTGESVVTRAHGNSWATVEVSDYHGLWRVNIWASDGTLHTGEIVL
jgi:hypothetical protein